LPPIPCLRPGTSPGRIQVGRRENPDEHLPWGLGSFRRKQHRRSYALAYLTNTIRSQGFSPSQRFDPARASWFCFTPHPPIGFRPTERFPLSQPWQLSLLSTLMLLDQLQFVPGNPRFSFAAVFSRTQRAPSEVRSCPFVPCTTQQDHGQHHLSLPPRRTVLAV
jgi:hypothetical protein